MCLKMLSMLPMCVKIPLRRLALLLPVAFTRLSVIGDTEKPDYVMMSLVNKTRWQMRSRVSNRLVYFLSLIDGLG